jgi:AraC-like DNA-binding protein
MPLFMDRHDVSEEVTAENVAQLHQADLKIQSQFGCKGLTYWFDDVRKTAFCLIDAPNAEAIRDMHRDAHGDVPHEVIEVDANIVESFLGRIEDPNKSQNVELNIINDPAFRCIMAIRFPIISAIKPALSHDDLKQMIVKIVSDADGRVVSQDFEGCLISFTNVSIAISSALEIQSETNNRIDSINAKHEGYQIGISTGVPVNKEPGFFEETIQTSKRLSASTPYSIAITSEVKELFESENLGKVIDEKLIYILLTDELLFLNALIDFIEEKLSDEKLSADDFYKQLGYSKSTFYRSMIALTSKSPKVFLNEYRLNQAVKLLKTQNQTVSEVGYATGFSSPSYFSKCFTKQFGIAPNDLKQ